MLGGRIARILQFHLRRADIVVELQTDRIAPAGLDVQRRSLGRDAVVRPVFQHLAAVDEETVAVVAAHGEDRPLRTRGAELTRPARREMIRGKALGRGALPEKVHFGMRRRHDRRTLQVAVGVELATKTRFAVRREEPARSGQSCRPPRRKALHTQPLFRCQTFGDGDVFERRALARTAAHRQLNGIGAQHHHPARPAPERKQSVVLQKHHRIAGNLQRRGVRFGIALRDRSVLLLTVEEPEGDERLQDMTALRVDRLLGDDTRSKQFLQILRIRIPCARHFEVQAVVHRTGDRVGRVPVRHEDTLEAPPFAQNADGKVAVLSHVLPVDEVVARHNGSHARLLDGLAEHRKVNLVKRTLVDVRRDVVAVVFLIVAAEMFDRGHHTLALHARDVCGRRLGRKVGILAVVLEITTAQRRAVDVHART